VIRDPSVAGPNPPPNVPPNHRATLSERAQKPAIKPDQGIGTLHRWYKVFDDAVSAAEARRGLDAIIADYRNA
jgi:hypothetical protein